MHKTYVLISIIILTTFLAGCAGKAIAQANEATPTSVPVQVEPTTTPEVVSREPPPSCLVTVPQVPPFVPPAPYDALGYEGYFWFGSNSLWTSLPHDAV